ncbi:MAG: serine protease [Ruminococcus sp.]|nr:serine protease [Ruminococcus sp.]
MSRINSVNAKRCIAVFMAVLMMILSLSYTGNNQTNALNTAQQYRIFNAKTGAKIGNDYTLQPVSTYNNTTSRNVIGYEERVIDWTKSGVVKIITSGGFGSGFVVSDHVIATAAHCLYNYKNQNAKIVSKILLFDTNGNITLQATPVQSHIPVQFITGTHNAGNNYVTTSDYALITVKEDLSDYACFDLGMPLTSFNTGNATVSVTGFPGRVGNPGNEVTVNTTTTHMMYTGNGNICNGDTTLLRYTADTSNGNSGGPVYITESLQGRTYYTVVAINIADQVSLPYTQNTGYRITTNLLQFYSGDNQNINW